MANNTSKQQLRDLVSDLIGCALIEGTKPTSMTASVETKAAKERLLDAIDAAMCICPQGLDPLGCESKTCHRAITARTINAPPSASQGLAAAAAGAESTAGGSTGETPVATAVALSVASVLSHEEDKARRNGAEIGISHGDLEKWPLDALMAFNLACDKLRTATASPIETGCKASGNSQASVSNTGGETPPHCGPSNALRLLSELDRFLSRHSSNAIYPKSCFHESIRTVLDDANRAAETSGEFERGVQIGKAIESAEGCICRGNWRAIVKETQTLLDQCFIGDDGAEYYLIGILHASDDYYYAMRGGKHGLRLLSCVGSIEGFGFSRAESSEKAGAKP